MVGLFMMFWEHLFGWIMYPRQPDETAQHGGPLGNTALVFSHGKLLATMEAGFPFLLKFCKGLIESVGAFTFGGQLKRAMTAHPKRHPVTGDLHAFHYKCASLLAPSVYHPGVPARAGTVPILRAPLRLPADDASCANVALAWLRRTARSLDATVRVVQAGRVAR